MNRFVLLPLFLLVSCGRPVVSLRSPAVFANELSYNTMVQTQAVGFLRKHLETHCFCSSEGSWSSNQCEKIAKHILVVESRGPWHREMAEYNASLRKERPLKKPPEIPAVSTLCGK